MNLDKRIKIRNLDVLMPDGKTFRLRWKEYQILSLLVARSPELVTRSEIVESIWKGTYCSDSTINQTIKSIRQKIGDTRHTLIRTIPRLGYKVENQNIFHFSSGEEEYSSEATLAVPDEEPQDAGEQRPEKVVAELAENDVPAVPTPDGDLATQPALAPEEDDQPPENRDKAHITPRLPHVPAGRVMKYLTALVSLLVISHFSYVLGNQMRPTIANDIQNNMRLVLTVTFNDPLNHGTQTLLCLYQSQNREQATLECVDSKPGEPKHFSSLDSSSGIGNHWFGLILPYKTKQYPSLYDIEV
ncbi:transcriptional regulator [Gibbsiella quercinecans]|uniref:transcriptional regulator n=1 Tax=Gibbsiella quercinecans TaxID=929813 RepID=UPI0024330678|nr:helix-turn-helix domain-containing protein [Gibbsiella quercinecans]